MNILAAVMSLAASWAAAQAPEDLCAFSKRPFDQSELRALSGQALDPSSPQAPKWVCKRRVTQELRAFQTELEREGEPTPELLARYKVLARYVPAGQPERRILDEKVVRVLARHFTPRASALSSGTGLTPLESAWLSAVGAERKAEVVRDAERLARAQPGWGSPQSPAQAGPTRPAGKPSCEADICEAFAARDRKRCATPSTDHPSRSCRALGEAMAGCRCP